jgi:catechol 2,3-dioxygenase-like lactoylglutathione lyase family enzyme
MKRFHVHLAVDELADSIRFYSTLFGAPPTVQKTDYAKWMVDDPRINFAISTRGASPGLNHLGFQVDSDDEFTGMRERLAAADAGLTEESKTHCCYSVSDKYWVTDPQGIAWETYHTLGDIPVFGKSSAETAHVVESACCSASAAESACCSPADAKAGRTVQGKAAPACCS